MSGGNIDYGPFSPTCRDTITHKSYLDCVETRTFLGDNRNKAHWLCSSLAAGNRFKVADLKRSGRTRYSIPSAGFLAQLNLALLS